MAYIKVLAILGSPRKGESYWGAQQVENQLKTHSDVEFEYLWLRDLYIQDCIGCHVYIFKGEEKCPLKDDMAKLQQKILEADAVIFTSPVYAL